ncbi:MAG: hypothetical protein DCF19_07550 [Pseudanabaena frigida]|uniref:Circadian input-output histidine kinase CikA n=1 Tax=Pseudanabaena frigida TaxID=945775 RepID=A0A2W4WBJ2_9CYAN|nr:MAG: hypothetical protein DCF19_07550 [Pseudanabaena frigida]
MEVIFRKMFSTHPASLPNFRIKFLFGIMLGMGISISTILIAFANQDFAQYIAHTILEVIADYSKSDTDRNAVISITIAMFLLGTVITSLIWIYRFFLQIEWRLASESVLSELTNMSAGQTLKDVMERGLLLLKEYSQADSAIALLQVDNVSTRNIASFPNNLLENWVIPPSLFAESLASQKCIYFTDYANSPNPSPILLAYGTKSLAILPLFASLPSNSSVQGAILLIWHKPHSISLHLQSFVQPLLNCLSLYLRIQTTNWELEKSSTKLSAILETIPQGVVFIDASGEQGWVNSAAARHLNVQAGNLAPHKISQAMTNLRMGCKNAAEIADEAAQLFANPDVKISNWLWIYENPQPLVLSISSTVTYVREVMGRLWVLDDVTDSYFARQELEIEKEKAEVATRTKSIFLANMSHDIRTPMNAIIGLTNILLDTELAEDQKDFLEIIRNSSDTLLVIINDILDFSKIEAGKMSLDIQSVNLRDVIEGIVSLFKKQVLDKHLQFNYKIEGNVPDDILTDVTRLRQVLFNLIGNAIKFTAVGKVSLLVFLENDTSIEQSQNRGGEEPVWLNEFNINQTDKILIHFAIQDTGIGISQEGIMHLFESFSQVDGSKARNYGGTGLGLAISHSLCKMMGGEMWVESQFNQGSVFHFTIQTVSTTCPVNFVDPLPVAKASANKFPPIAAPKCSLRILVAEDNLMNQKIAYLYLKKLGYEADFAENGIEVLKALEKKSYDLIFMDVQMPEMDGLETTYRIRELEKTMKTNPIQIIAMTANAMATDREECISVGMNDHIGKPIVLPLLQLVLDRCCEIIC